MTKTNKKKEPLSHWINWIKIISSACIIIGLLGLSIEIQQSKWLSFMQEIIRLENWTPEELQANAQSPVQIQRNIEPIQYNHWLPDYNQLRERHAQNSPSNYIQNQQLTIGSNYIKLTADQIPELKESLSVIGGLSSPEVGLRVALLNETTDETLYYGAGAYRMDQLLGKGNNVFVGHDALYSNILFEPLKRMKTGQLIYTSDLNTIYTYKVERIFKANAYDLSLLKDSPTPILTLITCSDNDLYRLVVQAKLIETESLAELSAANRSQRLGVLGF